jgi:hypothetical protein
MSEAARKRAFAAACALALLTSAGERSPAPARVSAPRAALPSPTSPVPDFVLFGWVSPPVESTTAARYLEMKGCGLDVALPAWADSGRREDNLARFGYAAESNVRCLAWDRRLQAVRFNRSGGILGEAVLDSVVADYRIQPGFLGYYFTDEPAAEDFWSLGRYHAALKARDPAHISFNNLLGRGAFATRAEWEAYVNAYADTVQPAVLCDDHYDFGLMGDRGQFVENAAGLAAIARARGLPFWVIVQLIQHGNGRALTAGELRWQASMVLAYGARGIGYFTYWTPDPDPNWNWQYGVIAHDGTRSSWYDVLAAFNPRVRVAGVTLAGAIWLSTEHAGSLPIGGTAFAPDDWVRAVDRRAALGEFAALDGTRLVFVVNADSMSARTIGLSFGSVERVERLGATYDSWEMLPTHLTPQGQRLDLPLEAGDFALLRLTGGASQALASGVAPKLAVGPVPASARLAIALEAVGERGRVEILDAGGRRVWIRALPPGNVSLDWRGERDDGGRAAPGVYFVRAEDARGVSAQRFVWLGR